MTNGKHKLDCKCLWDDDSNVIAFCGAHQEHHRKLTEPLLQDKAMLEHIRVYANNQHPLLSSMACPLCEWSGEVENGFWKGRRGKSCSYHYALHQLYALKIDGEADMWDEPESLGIIKREN